MPSKCATVLFTLLLLGASALVNVRDVFAQPGSEEALRGEVREAYNAGDYSRAREILVRMYAQEPSAHVLSLQGMCDFQLRRYADAAGELEAALTEGSDPLTAKHRADVTAKFATVRSLVGKLTLEVQPDLEQLELMIDGVRRSGRRFWLDAGEHVVEAKALGYHAVATKIALAAGQERQERMLLQPIEPPPAQNIAPAVAAAVLQPSAAKDSDVSAPLLTRWWFWTTVGAVIAAGVATAVVIHANTREPQYASSDLSFTIE